MQKPDFKIILRLIYRSFFFLFNFQSFFIVFFSLSFSLFLQENNMYNMYKEEYHGMKLIYRLNRSIFLD